MVLGYTYVHPEFEASVSSHQSELLEAGVDCLQEWTVLIERRSTVQKPSV